MARNMTAGNGHANGEANGEVSTKSFNLQQVRHSMKRGFNQLYMVEAEIADAEDKYLADLKKKRTQLWRQLKTDTNISRKVLDLDYRKYKYARQAEEEELENGPEILDAMAIAHEAMHPGQTVDWVTIVKNLDPSGTAKPKANGKLRDMPEYDAGKGVAKAGGERTDHDYQDGSDEAKAWQAGWDAGKKERSAAAKKPRSRKAKTTARATA